MLAPPERVAESEACPKDRWDYTVTDDGSFRIRFPRELAWKTADKRLALPLSFSDPALVPGEQRLTQ